MSSITVIGSQWGDEGKGKVVDWLSKYADAVIRFQGGHNAGHTLVINGMTYKLSLLPSGIIRQEKISVIGNGVVLNPWVLLEEIQKIREFGISISPDNLYIADNVCLILPPHWITDQARELAKGKSKIGTTGRGIGPAYEDKVARRAIRLCDLQDPDVLKNKIISLLEHHHIFLKSYQVSLIDPDALYRDLLVIREKILPFLKPVSYITKLLQNKNLIFEGAQGVMLDIDHGTYPFVTSSNTLASHAFTGTGIQSKNNHVLGVAKAYTTRVGSGPFPTLESGEIGNQIRERGHEFGTVTGRKRDCGWFDAVLVKQAIQVGGIDSLALTKIDVLDTLLEIKICVAYQLNGKTIDYYPALSSEQSQIIPVYETVSGWNSATQNLRNWSDLPYLAKAYVEKLENLIQIPISIVSTSPEREDILFKSTEKTQVFRFSNS